VDTADTVRDYLPRVVEFLNAVEEAGEDGDARDKALCQIGDLRRFARRFYSEFFERNFDVSISSFSYPDKRLVSRRLVDAEGERGRESPARRARLEIAAFYEDFCDVFHGDMEFGYSDDADDYALFHRETFPDWLESLSEWINNQKGSGNSALAKEVAALASRYRDDAAAPSVHDT
jgi:hypothetical protein